MYSIDTSTVSESKNILIEILEEAVYLELDSLDFEDAGRLAAFLALITKSGSYLYFSSDSIERLVTAVCNHLWFRQFVLGLQFRFALLATADGRVILDEDTGQPVDTSIVFKGIRKLLFLEKVNMKTRGLSAPPVAPGRKEVRSLIPDDILESMKAPYDEATIHDMENWILVLYMAIFTDAYSNAFQRYFDERKDDHE